MKLFTEWKALKKKIEETCHAVLQLLQHGIRCMVRNNDRE
jgi:hypothetical protein